jgi:hypothetical protein
MDFELKKAYSVGVVTSNNDGTMTQNVNITVVPVGCPYEDIKTEVTAKYVFDENLSAKQIEAGVPIFAKEWVATNYPAV